jgi:hypothetical protein
VAARVGVLEERQDLKAAVAAWQAGAMSRDTVFDVLRRGEIVLDGRGNEEEERLLGAEPPVAPAAGPNVKQRVL